MATNTSALRISEIAARMRDPQRLVGLHFWNPPQVVPCVEVIRAAKTSDQVFQDAVELVERIGKEPVKVQRGPARFPGQPHAARPCSVRPWPWLSRAWATAEDVDRVVKYGFGLRLAFMGPLERADLGGLDTTLRVQEYLLPDLDSRATPSPLLGPEGGQGRDRPQERPGVLPLEPGPGRSRGVKAGQGPAHDQQAAQGPGLAVPTRSLFTSPGAPGS